MITKRDLDEAIAECIGQRNPNASTCLKLAAYYTIRKELYGEPEDREPSYSFRAAPFDLEGVMISGDSEFAESVRGKDQTEVWAVIDELMQTVKVIHPRLYAAVLRELREK